MGLAIVIGLSQLSQFKVTNANGESVWMSGEPLLYSLGFVLVTMLVIWLLPKITKAIPATLVSILVVTGIVIGFDIPIPRVGDLASVKGGLPDFSIPNVPFNFETLKIILPYSIILAAIGLIESLLTLNLVSEITNKRGGASKECLAQGLANTVTGFFGGMGGCAMIGQSMINVKSGGRTRIAAVAAALFLLIFILYTSSLIELIPISCISRCYVYGGDWNICLELYKIIISSTKVRCFSDCVSYSSHRLQRLGISCSGRCNCICFSICMEICIKN